MLQAGILGLPNVGKSTLFNALTRSRKAEAANYPFCTIEPNVGVVEVPDERAYVLKDIAKTKVVIPAAIEFVDIAGLVAGASKGEGLGNKFLTNIREVDALVHVVRCFDNDDIIHNMGKVNPVRDIEVINTELILADMQSVEKQLETAQKKAKSREEEVLATIDLLTRLLAHLNESKPASSMVVNAEDRARLKLFNLLSTKSVLYTCNVAEGDIADPDANPHVVAVKKYVADQHGCGVCVISAQVEAELCELSPEDCKEFLGSLGVTDSGVSQLIKESYKMLGLATYFTAGEKEVRCWTFKNGMTAPQCAAVIHTDFEKNFIRAEVVAYDDLAKLGSVAAARDAGKYRSEGKEYLFKDGDVALFRVNP